MPRTRGSKALYVTLVLAGGAVLAAVLLWADGHPIAIGLAIVVTLLPGRIQGYYWRSFFRGRRLLGAGDPARAVGHFNAFIDQLAARPSLKRLIWLSWGMYTRDIEVMTLNNLGAAHLQLGELDNAEVHLERAGRLDPQSPLPWHNLSLVYQARG